MPTSSDLTALHDYSNQAAPQIAAWVRNNVCPLEHEKGYGKCSKIVVRHLSDSYKATGDVGVIVMSSREVDTPGGIDLLINDIIEYAQADADGLRKGVQTYGVYAYYDRQPTVLRKIFRVATEEAVDPESQLEGTSEPATPNGLFGMLMRHLEAESKNHQVGMGYIIDSMRRTTETLQQQNTALMNQQIEFSVLMQETLNEQNARQIEQKKADLQLSMAEGIFENLKHIFPIIANKLSGQKLLPETDPSFTMLMSLYEGMPQEQQQEFVTRFLTPPQAALFGEIIETYNKRKAEVTSSGNPGSKLNLSAMFDPRTERMKTDQTLHGDRKMVDLEERGNSYMEIFRNLADKMKKPSTLGLPQILPSVQQSVHEPQPINNPPPQGDNSLNRPFAAQRKPLRFADLISSTTKPPKG